MPITSCVIIILCLSVLPGVLAVLIGFSFLLFLCSGISATMWPQSTVVVALLKRYVLIDSQHEWTRTNCVERALYVRVLRLIIILCSTSSFTIESQVFIEDQSIHIVSLIFLLYITRCQCRDSTFFSLVKLVVFLWYTCIVLLNIKK